MNDGTDLDRGTGVEVWSSPQWLRTAVVWLDEQLAAAGIDRTGEVEQPRVRPWATMLTAPTTVGPVWLKAAGPGTAFEVGLYELLHRVTPARVLPPIGSDVTRGWIVLPDGGPPLAERLAGAELVDAMVRVLPQYGQLQRDLAPHAADMLGLGVTDMRAGVMPVRLDEAVEAASAYVEHRGGASERATLQRVVALRPAVVSWCDELAGMPGMPSLDHNDLHPGNILLDGPGLQARFYDWGDSVVAHPFASMLMGLGSVGRGAGPRDQRILRMRDAYLEVFGDLAPHAELVEALELACRVGKIARALIWDRAVRALGGDPSSGDPSSGDPSSGDPSSVDPGTGVDDEWASAPFETLAALLDEYYLAGA